MLLLFLYRQTATWMLLTPLYVTYVELIICHKTEQIVYAYTVHYGKSSTLQRLRDNMHAFLYERPFYDNSWIYLFFFSGFLEIAKIILNFNNMKTANSKSMFNKHYRLKEEKNGDHNYTNPYVPISIDFLRVQKISSYGYYPPHNL